MAANTPRPVATAGLPFHSCLLETNPPTRTTDGGNTSFLNRLPMGRFSKSLSRFEASCITPTRRRLSGSCARKRKIRSAQSISTTCAACRAPFAIFSIILSPRHRGPVWCYHGCVSISLTTLRFGITVPVPSHPHGSLENQRRRTDDRCPTRSSPLGYRGAGRG